MLALENISWHSPCYIVVKVLMPLMKMSPRPRPGLWIGAGLSFGILLSSGALRGAPTRADVQSNEPVAADLSLQPASERLAQAHAHYVSARMLEEEGRMREALGHYLAFLEKGGAEPDLVAHIAEMALNYQGMEAALKLLEDAIKASPSGAQPYVNLTNFALTHGSTENDLLARATTAATEAMSRFPQSAEAYENAVRLHLFQKERAKAAEALERGARQPVTDVHYWLRLGRAAQELWPLADAEQRAEHVARVNVFFDKAMLRAREARDEEAELWIADYFLFSNQLDRAAEICEGVVHRNGSLDSRKRLVRLYEALERPDDSLKALESLVAAYPTDVEHQRLLASRYEQRGRTAFGEERKEFARKAAEHFEAALQAGGGDVDDYIKAATYIESTGDEERFERFTARAQQLYPGEPRVGYLRALALNSVKKHADAAKMFEETAKLAKTRLPDLLNDASYHFSWGAALERSGQYDAAAKAFEKSVDLTPPDNPPSAASTMNYWGYMWVEQDKHLDKAETLLRKANELRPDVPAFIDSLGWLYFRQGKYKEALAELERAEKLMEEWTPEDAEILDHVAQTHQKLGNADKAKEYWQRALDLNPPQETIRERAERELGLEKPKPPPNAPPEEKPDAPPAAK